MGKPEGNRDFEVLLDGLAEWIHLAWGSYMTLFEEEPHGTYRQIRCMVEFKATELLKAIDVYRPKT